MSYRGQGASEMYAALREETRQAEEEDLVYQQMVKARERQRIIENGQPRTDQIGSPSNGGREPLTVTHDPATGNLLVTSLDGTMEEQGQQPINQETAKYVASRQRKIITDDDVLQVASSISLVSENITPFMFGYHDECLSDFLQGVLNRPIESIRLHHVDRAVMVRCTCPAFQPTSSSSSQDNKQQQQNGTDWLPHKVILVILKASGLLVPSGTNLKLSVYETMNLTCLNHEYMAVKGTPEEASWRATRFGAGDGEVHLMLGFDQCINLTIVKNHSDSAFEGYKTAASILSQGSKIYRGFNGVSEIEKSCEYVVQLDAPRDPTQDLLGTASPWGQMQFLFISLPKVEELLINKLPPTQLLERVKTSGYARWLWFLTKQDRVSFVSEVPSPIMEDQLVRSLWFSLSTVALTEPILEGWSMEAEKEARNALIQPYAVEHQRKLEKFQNDMQKFSQRSLAVDGVYETAPSGGSPPPAPPL